MDLTPETLKVAERYKLLIGSIVPRPIAFVSTISKKGEENLAPFSFFTGVGSNPMTLLFCPANKDDGSEKDTLRNCSPESDGGQGQFVVNIVSASFIRQAVAAAEPFPYGTSEFGAVGLTPSPSRAVRPSRVFEAPIAFECQTLHVLRTNPGQPSGGNVVLGRVLHVHVREDLINDRLHIDPALLDAVGRMGGQGYCFTRERFDLPMGMSALSRPDPA